jgi:hypothetical protein
LIAAVRDAKEETQARVSFEGTTLMDQEPITQLTGKIENLFAEGGVQPRLRFSVNVNNKNKCGFELANVTARLHVQFEEEGGRLAGGLGSYVGDVTREIQSNSLQPGDQNSLMFYIPIPFAVFAEIENSRGDKNVVLQMNIAYVVIQRTTGGELGQRFLATELNDQRSGGNQFLAYSVPKSQWEGLLKTLGYSKELGASKQTLLKLVEDARCAKDLAEEYARDAKAASSLTAVTTLSQAYHDEAIALNITSRWWLISAFFLALLATALMVFYVYESFAREFTTGQTVLRVFVLAAVFAGLGLCLRYYSNYKHLQLLNRHRVNIGRTFEALKAVQPSDEAKNLLAAITAEQMVNFGRVTLQGKDASETQFSIVAELLKTFIERQKT